MEVLIWGFGGIGFILGIILAICILHPSRSSVKKANLEVEQYNADLEDEKQKLEIKVHELVNILTNLEKDKKFLVDKKENLSKDITFLEENSKQTADILYHKNNELMQTKLDESAQRMSEKYQALERTLQKEYLDMMTDFVKEHQDQFLQKKNELDALTAQLAELKELTDAAVEANIRAQKQQEEQNFYRLTLLDIDIEEIKRLQEVSVLLRNSEPLNKVIWKVYYEKPFTDLIGRVVGKDIKTGIYKITNLDNQMCYVGQAVDIASRWRQHVKRGLGAETPTRNKLYPAMKENGVENFSFEIIEECPREKLNDREDYWQEYFHAKDFGYSIK